MKRSFFVATPLYDGNLQHGCVAGMLQTLAKYGQERVTFAARQGSFLPRLRDMLTADFLKSPAEFMLCVDSDIAWTVAHLDALASQLEELTLDREMVAGLYPRKSLRDTRPTAALLDETREGTRGFTLQAAACVGAGFLLVHRSGIARMVEKYADLAYDDGQVTGVWSPFCAVKTSDGRAMYLGEDYSFCQRWREMGGKIWAVPSVKLGHVGSMLYQMGGDS